MKPTKFILFLTLILSVIGCAGQPTVVVTIAPVATNTMLPTASATYQFTKTPRSSTSTPSLSSLAGLPDTVQVDGNKITFSPWEFSINLPLDVWGFNGALYNRTPGFEGFGFCRMNKLVDSSGKGYSPCIGILFYAVPEGTQLINFSVNRQTKMGDHFPSIESTFGYEGSEPRLNFPALGYYGHLGEGKNYSVYVVHAVNGTVGIQIAFEIVDSVLDQAKPEFFSIMQSMMFEEKSITSIEATKIYAPIIETDESMMSAYFISQALKYGGEVDLSKGSDGHGKGVDAYGIIYTCSDLALNLTKYQGYTEITINDESELLKIYVVRGDVVIFTDSRIPGITAHAAIITKLENGTIFITGKYGPREDGTYTNIGYEDWPVSKFFPIIFKAIHIYHHGR